MVPGKTMNFPDKSYGISVIKDMIVLGGMEKLYFLSMTGSLLKTFNVGSSYLYSMKTGKVNMIYCCSGTDDTLHCIDINGTVIFSHKSPDFKGPVDLAIDGKENLYMTIYRSHQLHRLSKEGNLNNILLRRKMD